MKKAKVILLVVLLFALVTTLYGCKNDIIFHVDGEVYSAVSFETGISPVLPTEPHKDGYVFEGWYLDEGVWNAPFSIASLVNLPIKNNVNVYAHFVEEGKTCTVTFNTMGGNELSSEMVEYGKTLKGLSVPVREGYLFSGWFLMPDYSSPFAVETMAVTTDLTLYAKWVPAFAEDEEPELIRNDYLSKFSCEYAPRFETQITSEAGETYVVYYLGTRYNIILNEVNDVLYYNVPGQVLKYSLANTTAESFENRFECTYSLGASLDISVNVWDIANLAGSFSMTESWMNGYSSAVEKAQSMENSVDTPLDACELNRYYTYAVVGNEDVYQYFKYSVDRTLVETCITASARDTSIQVISSTTPNFSYPSEEISFVPVGIPNSDEIFGDGTAKNPYRISTAEQLKGIANDLDAHYKLVDNIDVSNMQWEPIGGISGQNKFVGTLDGKKNEEENYKIIGLNKKGTGTRVGSYTYWGLFSVLSEQAVVSNIDFVDANISIGGDAKSSDRMFNGIVAGKIEKSATITNVTTTGEISHWHGETGWAFVGGIVGSAWENFTISNCENNCNVTAMRYAGSAGGIAGFSAGGRIIDCTNNGNVLAKGTWFGGKAFAGGIVGMMYTNAETLIEGWHNTGVMRTLTLNDRGFGSNGTKVGGRGKY